MGDDWDYTLFYFLIQTSYTQIQIKKMAKMKVKLQENR